MINPLFLSQDRFLEGLSQYRELMEFLKISEGVPNLLAEDSFQHPEYASIRVLPHKLVPDLANSTD